MSATCPRIAPRFANSLPWRPLYPFPSGSHTVVIALGTLEATKVKSRVYFGVHTGWPGCFVPVLLLMMVSAGRGAVRASFPALGEQPTLSYCTSALLRFTLFSLGAGVGVA